MFWVKAGGAHAKHRSVPNTKLLPCRDHEICMGKHLQLWIGRRDERVALTRSQIPGKGLLLLWTVVVLLCGVNLSRRKRSVNTAFFVLAPGKTRICVAHGQVSHAVDGLVAVLTLFLTGRLRRRGVKFFHCACDICQRSSGGVTAGFTMRTGRRGPVRFNLWKGLAVTQFSAPWPHVSVISIIDILLVAVIIYEFLALIKGTRAALMLVGVAALALAFYFSRLGELTTLNWLISNLLPYAVFALIVVFAPEIRQALARLGRRVTLSRRASEADAYDDIVLAANLLSQNQTGALIVIEREIGLRTYVENGGALAAQPFHDLLDTIFHPRAPLHDGAVIVQEERIAAAACFLPLSMNPVLSTQMGTRHRAGIGITEETDAIAMIVSEETGAISLAV